MLCAPRLSLNCSLISDPLLLLAPNLELSLSLDKDFSLIAKKSANGFSADKRMTRGGGFDVTDAKT